MSKYNPKRYRLEEENSHRFYQMPKELFINPRYKDLDSNAKVLYTVLLDRKELSRKNKWVDEYNQIYLIYTRENIAELLGVSVRTVIKVFKQLREAKLIEEEKQGLNKPNRIYVLHLDYSGHAEIAPQEVQELHPSDTDYSETDTRVHNIKGKPLTTVSLYNSINLKRVVDKETTSIIREYADIYNAYFEKRHPNLKEEQLKDIENKVSELNSVYGLGVEEWHDLIIDYFETSSYGDGNVNRFFHGNSVQGVIRGLLN